MRGALRRAMMWVGWLDLDMQMTSVRYEKEGRTVGVGGRND